MGHLMNLMTLVRRSATRWAMLGTLRMSSRLSFRQSRSIGLAMGRLGHMMPFLRNRLRDNLRAAGVDHSDATVRTYFQRYGTCIGESLGIYGTGLDAFPARVRVELDPSTIHRLDEAVAKGNGVVIASPHLFGHEIAAGLIHRRHPLTAIVRESKDPTWEPVKDRWYAESLGLNTVKRPRKETAAEQMRRMLGVLRQGKVLAITPDVITSRSSAVPVQVFGRTVKLSPGMVLLAMRSGAPLITAYGQWDPDPTCPGYQRARVLFTEPFDLPRRGDLETLLRNGLQRWCGWFEDFLRQSPADWQFWLDKGWTKILRQPRAHGA